MTSDKEDIKLTEFEPLTRLFQVLPTRVHKAFYTYDTEWTCIDVNKEYIAVGTNVGVVFLVERNTEKLQKLFCKGKNPSVSKIKMCHTVDHMVAVGTSGGQLFVFQLPSILPGRNKQLHLYEVLDVHHSQITSLTWSQNSQKLFSGDNDGLVYCTEFEYDKENYARCQSYFILKEPNEIVQLDYTLKVLLVSTRWRTILFLAQEKNILQVGKKDRKTLGKFGAVFLPGGVHSNPQDLVLFASRPGYRLWKACSADGSVQSTYIFKDLIEKTSEGLTLLESTINIHDIKPCKIEDAQFGPLFIYQDIYLVTFHQSGIFIIDPGQGTFIGYHTNIGPIIDVAVHEDEIYILRNGYGRRIVRLAETPYVSPSSVLFQDSKYLSGVSSSDDTNKPSKTEPTKFARAFKEVGEKIQDVIEAQNVFTKKVDPPWGYAKGAMEEDILSQENTELPADQSNDQQNKTKELNSSLMNNDTALIAPGLIAPLQAHHPGAPALIVERINNKKEIPESDVGDIVFSAPKQKKKGKKKVKEKDKDTSSIASNELQVSYVENTSGLSGSKSETESVQNSENTSEENGILPNNSQISNEVDTQDTSFEEKETDNAFNIPNSNQTNQTCQKSQEELEKVRKQLESELTALPVFESEDHTEKSNITLDEPLIKSDVHGFSGINQVNEFSHDTNNDDCEDVEIELEASEEIINDELLDEKNNTMHLQIKENSLINDRHIFRDKSSPQHCDNPLSGFTVIDKSSSISEKDTEAVTHKTLDSQTVESSELEDLNYSKNDSLDDFYSMYNKGSNSSRSSISSSRVRSDSVDEKSIEDALEHSASQSSQKDDSATESEKFEEKVQNVSGESKGSVDSWTEFLAPGNLQCICVTQRHVWAVDKSDKIYWSYLSGSGIKWHRLERSAQQISVSSSGAIVWRVHNGALYVGTKITDRAPAGLKWVDFVQKDVVYISVDDNMGWYVKGNGEVVMHKKLSRERPCFKPIKVPSKLNIIQVSCKNNVVWALTIDRLLVVRMGIKPDVEEGMEWRFLEGGGPGILVSSCDLGPDHTAWVIDVVGRVWFTTGIAPEKPQGSGQWWQVSLAEYLMQDSNALDTIKSIASNPKKLVKMMKQEDKGGLIAARCNGVWVCPGFKNNIHVCGGSVKGHRWDQLNLPGMVSSINKWTNISVGGMNGRSGLIWAQQPSGDLFCFNPNTPHSSAIKVLEVSPPDTSSGKPFKCINVLSNVVWALMPSGKVYLRTDMRPSCPQGISWVNLNLQQLGDVKILWLSAGSQNVWALDTTGQIYLRIGVEPPSKRLLNPAWVPVEGTPRTLGAKFVKVFAGPSDWMVWALDSYGNIYVRKGITDSMPIGTHWVFINAPKTDFICIGEKYVYGLTEQGEIIIREGITMDNPKGDGWSKTPGCLVSISVTSEGDKLWGINKEGQLCQRFAHSLDRKEVLDTLKGVPLCALRGEDVEGGWELL